MSEVTQLLNSVEHEGEEAAGRLLPLVYEELRQLAARRMANEPADHTLQPTALVLEAWLRLTVENDQVWANRAHFFGAAAEAMRRILVERARRKQAAKRGSGAATVELDESALILAAPADELLAVHEALETLAEDDPEAAELVKLRYFVGMTMAEAASALGLAKRTAENLWAYARVRLHREIRGKG